ncbi:hypothetical protein COCNU_scaffold010623G000010 [Cocos nucifera]|nr:hypothetical protein [Cocos nucifera]
MREEAIEDYRDSEEFKEAILEGDSISYWIRYEDGRDVVEKFFFDLDLSYVTIPEADGEDEPTDAVEPNSNEAAPMSIDVEPVVVEDQRIKIMPATDTTMEETDG